MARDSHGDDRLEAQPHQSEATLLAILTAIEKATGDNIEKETPYPYDADESPLDAIQRAMLKAQEAEASDIDESLVPASAGGDYRRLDDTTATASYRSHRRRPQPIPAPVDESVRTLPPPKRGEKGYFSATSSLSSHGLRPLARPVRPQDETRQAATPVRHRAETSVRQRPDAPPSVQQGRVTPPQTESTRQPSSSRRRPAPSTPTRRHRDAPSLLDDSPASSQQQPASSTLDSRVPPVQSFHHQAAAMIRNRIPFLNADKERDLRQKLSTILSQEVEEESTELETDNPGTETETDGTSDSGILRSRIQQRQERAVTRQFPMGEAPRVAPPVPRPVAAPPTLSPTVPSTAVADKRPNDKLAILRILTVDLWTDQASRVSAALYELANLCCNSSAKENRVRTFDYGGHLFCMGVLRKFFGVLEVQEAAMCALVNVSCLAASQASIGAAAGAKLIVACMNRHPDSDLLQRRSCMCLNNLVRDENNATRLIKAGGAEAVVNAMHEHGLDATLQRAGCSVLYRLCRFSPLAKEAIGSAGGVSAIGRALEQDLDDTTSGYAKSAMLFLMNKVYKTIK